MGGFRLSTTQRENVFYKGLGPVPRSETYPYEGTIMTLRERYLILSQCHFRHETSEGTWTTNYAPDDKLTDGIWEGALTFDALKRLLSENLIRLPTITEDEISDKGKGDAITIIEKAYSYS